MDGCPGESFRSIRYPTHLRKSRKGEGIARRRTPSRGVWHAQSQHRFSIPSGVAGTNLRKTARYAGKNCDPLQCSALRSRQRNSPISGTMDRRNRYSASCPVALRQSPFSYFCGMYTCSTNLRTGSAPSACAGFLFSAATMSSNAVRACFPSISELRPS